MLKRLTEICKNIIYPPRCPGCGASVPVQGEWCDTCTAGIFHFRMIDGSRRSLGLDGCYALADYTGAVRRALSRLKYNGKVHYGPAFHYMLERFPWPERIATCDLVVPVPLYPLKEKKRGFNQNDIIFRPWAESHRLKWAEALQRVRPTASQYSLDREERRENIQRAFAIKSSFCRVQGHILLVDDIYTTGATMQTCAAVLKRKGAKKVTGLAIAGASR